MRKIVYIHPSQLTERWIKYYCLEKLKNDYSVEYWDCSRIAHPSFKSNKYLYKDYLLEIGSIDHYEQNLIRIPRDSLIIVDLHRTKDNLPLFKLLKKHFEHRIFINLFSNTQKSYKNKYWAKIRESNFSDIIAYFKVKRMFRLFYIGGPQESEYPINHPDYEEFIRCRNLKGEHSTPYAVYVDNYFPLHPEVSQRNPSFRAKELAPLFYSSLNRYFELIEREYGLKVVIAAHPSAVYEDNPFEGREIVCNKTCELIKNSQMVCMHTSNSLSYVILYNKPVALLSNDVYRQASLEFMRLENVSKMIKVEITDMDERDCRIHFDYIDKGFCDNYKKKYLIAEENTSNYELYKRHFEKIYAELYGGDKIPNVTL